MSERKPMRRKAADLPRETKLRDQRVVKARDRMAKPYERTLPQGPQTTARKGPTSRANPKQTHSNSKKAVRREIPRQNAWTAGDEVNKGARPRPRRGYEDRSRSQKRRPAPPSKVKKSLLLLWDGLFYGFLLIVVAGVVMFNFNDNPKKALFGGYRLMTVLTNSMAPVGETPEYTDGFRSGALIVVKKVNPEKLKAGDIITFNPVADDNSTYLTHRIIKVQTELEGEEGLFFTTKGDANSGEDIPFKASQVVGQVIFKIPNIGNIMKFLKENIVMVGLFILSVLAFFAVLKYYLGMEENRGPAPRKKRAVN